MLITLIVCTIAVLLPLFNKSNGLKYAFILLAAFIGLRYDYGSDYMDYLNGYVNIGSSLADAFNDDGVKYEWLWRLIVVLSKPIGYFGLNIVISSFECYVLYKSIHKYVPQRWQWLAVFLYAFSFEYFLIGAASMLRQWLTICIFIATYPLIKNRNIVPFFIIVIAANFIHRSAIILLPFYFVTYLQNVKISKVTVAVILAFFGMWWYLAPDYVFEQLNMLFAEDSQVGFYDRYMNNSASVVTIGVGIFMKIVMVTICLTQIKEITDNKLLLLLYVCTLLFMPLSGVSGLAGRITMYFSVFSILVVPMVTDILREKNMALMYILIICSVIVSLYDFVLAFGRDETWNIANYQTIFSTTWQ